MLALGAYAVIALTAVSAVPTTVAQPIVPAPVEDHSRAIECMTLAIAYEAGLETLEGQRAVAEVILNRVRKASFPKSVCDVVFAGSTRRTGCQFTFTCDGSLRRRLPNLIISKARIVAEQAINGKLSPLVGGATHYHADYVSPYWAPSLERVGKIGAHIFYRQPGLGSGSSPVTPSSPKGAPPSAPPQPFTPWGLAPPIALVPGS